jgi:hypothetical protein
MQTKREYLAGLTPPLAIAGARGRLSKAAHEALAEAEKNGMTFSDSHSPGVGKTDSSTSDSAPKVKKDSANPATFFGPTPAQVYDGGWYIEVGDSKITLSGREVCRTCGNSLDWHRCATPTFPSEKGEMIPVLRKLG